MIIDTPQEKTGIETFHTGKTRLLLSKRALD